MPRERQQVRVELHAGVGGQPEAERSDVVRELDDVAFRILLLGDFSARAQRETPGTGRALAARRPIRVDRDNVDDAVGRLSPAVVVRMGDSGESTIRFSELDDFHPDRLYERLPRIRALRDARDLAAAPAPRDEVGRRTGRIAGGPSGASGSILDQILGDVPLPPGGAAAAGRSEPAHATTDPLTDFVRRTVAPHVVPDPSPADPERVADAEATISDELRAILHQPEFQALEAAWRTVDFLVRRLETDATLQVHLLDVSKGELAADLARAPTPAESDTYRLLVPPGAGADDGPRWTLIVGLFAFGAEERDVALLASLGAIARAAAAPFVAAADPALLGCPSFGTAGDPDDWTPREVPGWDALRRSEQARSIGLTAPRFLLRLPYGGPDGQSCDVAGFEEISAPDAHEEYLWGNSAALCALLHGEAFAAGGWSGRPHLEVPGLPFHLLRVDGDVTAKPCAEAVLSNRAVERIAGSGVMAVQSRKDGDRVRFHRMQSIAEPLASLALRAGAGHDGG